MSDEIIDSAVYDLRSPKKRIRKKVLKVRHDDDAACSSPGGKRLKKPPKSRAKAATKQLASKKKAAKKKAPAHTARSMSVATTVVDLPFERSKSVATTVPDPPAARSQARSTSSVATTVADFVYPIAVFKPDSDTADSRSNDSSTGTIDSQTLEAEFEKDISSADSNQVAPRSMENYEVPRYSKEVEEKIAKGEPGFRIDITCPSGKVDAAAARDSASLIQTKMMAGRRPAYYILFEIISDFEFSNDVEV